MADLDLAKGQRVELAKDGVPVTAFKFAGGWDPKSGVSQYEIDVDIQVAALDAAGKLVALCFYNSPNKEIFAGAVKLDKDDRSGASSAGGDDETVNVDLTKIPANVTKLVFIEAIYEAESRRQNFGMVNNAFGRVVDNSGVQVAKLNLTEDYSLATAVKVLEVYRYETSWKINATAEGIQLKEFLTNL